MIKPNKPFNEAERLHELRSYRILDSLPEAEYDDITKLAAYICQTPISLISLLDENRQWFKSAYGVEAKETARDIAFCAHAINNPSNVMVVEDSRKDERFFDNPLVTEWPQVISYTGYPLVSSGGYALGVLCVIDNKPRKLSEDQQLQLKALANQVIKLLELRKAKALLEENLAKLTEKNLELKKFSSIVAHDIRSPLINITGLIDLIRRGFIGKYDGDTAEILGLIEESVVSLSSLVTCILEHNQNDNTLAEMAVEFDLTVLIQSVVKMLDSRNVYRISYPDYHPMLVTNRTALQQILINLIANSIKHNQQTNLSIQVIFEEDENTYKFGIKDNGHGVDVKHINHIIKNNHTEPSIVRSGVHGNGIGLYTVRRLVEGLAGSISVESEPHRGMTFWFTIKKQSSAK